jgi:homoserine O-acetyltransferase
MDLEEQHGSLQQAFAKWRGRTLLVSFDTDWLFPVSEVERVEAAMIANGTSVQHERISSPNGHDTFLIDYDLITEPVRAFLDSLPGSFEVA